MRKTKIFILSVFLIGIIAACGTNNDPVEEDGDTNTTNDEIVDSQPNEKNNDQSGNNEAGNDEEGNNDNEQTFIPEAKELEVLVEGQVDKRVAHLTVSDLDYSLFVLENFVLEPEEPGQDVLLFENDDAFFVRIEPMGNNIDVQEIESQIIEHAQGSIEEDHHSPLTNVHYSILEMYESASEMTAIIHVAKDFNGNLFKFTMFIPGTEAAEGVEPSFWAMLETISVGE